MTLHNPDDTTVNRRTVLKQLGVAGVSAVGLVGASGTAAAACDLRWEVGTCVVAAIDDLPIVDGPCSGTQIGQSPQGAIGIIKDVACCGPDNATPFYYVDWCDSRIEDGWIRQDGLERSEECCDTSCDFKWDLETCVEANAANVPVLAEPCSPDQIGEVYEGAEGVIREADCCGEEVAREFYYVEWCDPDLVDGWVSQTALRRATDCCNTSCEFKWDLEACVGANTDSVPVLAEPCSPDQIGEVYEGAKGIVREVDCCGEEVAREFYYVDWCDPDLVDGWVSQADLWQSEGCCDEVSG